MHRTVFLTIILKIGKKKKTLITIYTHFPDLLTNFCSHWFYSPHCNQSCLQPQISMCKLLPNDFCSHCDTAQIYLRANKVIESVSSHPVSGTTAPLCSCHSALLLFPSAKLIPPQDLWLPFLPGLLWSEIFLYDLCLLIFTDHLNYF